MHSEHVINQIKPEINELKELNGVELTNALCEKYFCDDENYENEKLEMNDEFDKYYKCDAYGKYHEVYDMSGKVYKVCELEDFDNFEDFDKPNKPNKPNEPNEYLNSQKEKNEGLKNILKLTSKNIATEEFNIHVKKYLPQYYKFVNLYEILKINISECVSTNFIQNEFKKFAKSKKYFIRSKSKINIQDKLIAYKILLDEELRHFYNKYYFDHYIKFEQNRNPERFFSANWYEQDINPERIFSVNWYGPEMNIKCSGNKLELIDKVYANLFESNIITDTKSYNTEIQLKIAEYEKQCENFIISYQEQRNIDEKINKKIKGKLDELSTKDNDISQLYFKNMLKIRFDDEIEKLEKLKKKVDLNTRNDIQKQINDLMNKKKRVSEERNRLIPTSNRELNKQAQDIEKAYKKELNARKVIPVDMTLHNEMMNIITSNPEDKITQTELFEYIIYNWNKSKIFRKRKHFVSKAYKAGGNDYALVADENDYIIRNGVVPLSQIDIESYYVRNFSIEKFRKWRLCRKVNKIDDDEYNKFLEMRKHQDNVIKKMGNIMLNVYSNEYLHDIIFEDKNAKNKK